MKIRTLLLALALLAPLTTSAQAPVDCVAILDADGTRLGRATWSFDRNPGFYVEHAGNAVMLRITQDELHGNDSAILGVRFLLPNCTGQAVILYGVPGLTTIVTSRSIIINETEVWYADPSQPILFNTTAQSVLDDTGCTNEPFLFNFAPALNFTLPAFTPPFRLVPEACNDSDPDPDHTHTYLTGIGEGHNNTEAETDTGLVQFPAE